jgi:hypothetical protein
MLRCDQRGILRYSDAWMAPELADRNPCRRPPNAALTAQIAQPIA